MHIIQIEPNENGSHNQQTCNIPFFPPEGWAMIPDDVVIPEEYPFVFLEAAEGIVTSMTPNREAYDLAIEKQQKEQASTTSTEETDPLVSALID